MTISQEPPFKSRYENFIGGEWKAPVKGAYMKDISPVDGRTLCEVPQSTAEDVELALDAAHKVFKSWAHTSIAERSNILLKIADRMEANLDLLARAETWDNGKPIRETLNADIPLAVDHFRYFAGCIRAQEGGITEINGETMAYHFHEPLGVVGQIIPWNFPLLMASWKLAPALAAGNCIVMKPAETTPASILVLMELIGDLLPPGTLNIVNGLGRDVGAALSTSPRIAKVAFTGSTPTGKMIYHAAAENLIPATLELGGKSPNIFFADVMDHDDDYLDKVLEGFTLFALNQGQICSCPSRALVQESIYEKFMERVLPRVKAIKQGNPLDPQTMMGAQNSLMQQNKILEYIDIGKNQDHAQLLSGGARPDLGNAFKDGFYVQPTVFRGDRNMRIFREEIFGPVLTVTTFKDEAEALALANDTEFGLGSGVWSRNGNTCFRTAQGLEAGRVWVNCYHVYPAGAAFGGYKKSGIGRETHKMVLEHYQQTKNMLVSYSEKKLGFF
ncbi:aldehyde dehydrogenase [Acetobacter estunensis NRIC 0472]|uniref:Aldehyde dehydrogenase family protein n=1 Tax=Acetobacter estunensis TaxID=104097 RepID=A0A967B3G7_9PROT|nr:aldehyde dehydrogenase family protein [Acetobacter estunensis]NHO52544.1 aldehyde dehydrogenase family protein [Acetobacter estunensis]GBQ26275.1 aldehyde dehydrogenase [Acetobacter estunensis NRIC 0472]